MFESFDAAKTAVLTLMKDLMAQGIQTTLVAYDSSTNCYMDQSATDLAQIFSRMSAGGGTNFTEVFGYVASMLENASADPAVVFFSDGQDTSDTTPGKKNVDLAFQMLRGALTRPGITSEVHSIGFTSDHDAVLLGRIARLGTSQGTFQYVQQAAEISAALDTVLEMTAGPKVACSLILPNADPQPLFLDDTFTATIFVDAKTFDPNLPATLMIGEIPQEISFEKEPDSSLTVLVIKHIEAEIHHMHDQLTGHPSRAVLDQLKARINAFDNRLNEVIKDCFKLSRLDRKTAMQDIQTTKELVGRFNSDLASAYTGTLNNDQIAKFTALAYKKVTKKGLQKKLDQRVAKNVEIFDKLESQLQTAVSSVDFPALNARVPEDAKDELTCALSMKNYIEALEDGDCLCLTMNVGRSQAAIADPSQLTIKSVFSTLLTADSFMDSLKYAVEAAENPEAAHGGFVRDMVASVVKGLAREDITGIMPLYIDEDHWKVAKLKMKPVMGWTTCLDVLGYSYSQIKTVPFLVLAKVMEEAAGGSEFKKKQFDLVLDTCAQIYKDSNMRDELQDMLFKYTRSPLNRTIDVVQHNFVFLGQLLAAVKCEEIDLAKDEITLKQFIQQMTEEQVRRRLNYGFEAPEADDLVALLGVDKDFFITSPCEKFERDYKAFMDQARAGKGASPWKAAIQALLGEDAKPTEVDSSGSSSLSAPKLEAPEFTGEIEVTPIAEQFIKKGCRVVSENVHLIRQFMRLFTKAPNALVEDYSASVALLNDHKKLLALLLQCYLQRRNSDRREAIENGKYFDPFANGTEIQIFKQVMNEIILAERNRRTNDIINAEAAKASSNVALVFGATSDADEAAGIVKLDCRSIGARDGTFARLVQSLFDPKCPEPAEKIKILSQGQYKGITTLSTRKTSGVPQTWSPSRANFAKIWAAHMNVFTKEQWISLFPTLAPHIERKYAFLEGHYSTKEAMKQKEEEKKARIAKIVKK